MYKTIIKCKKQKKMTSLTDLPNDVLTIILQNVSKEIVRKNISTPSLAIKTLLRLESTSKYLKNIINNDIWKSAWDAYTESNPELKSIDANNPKECLLLYSLTGCQFCKTPRIRKIYPEFRARCCKECLYARTISDYRLSHDYLVDISQVKNLPSTRIELWARKIGTYRLNFYWKDDVEKQIGLSLQEYHKREKDRLDVIAKEREAERMIQENIRKETLLKDVHILATNAEKYKHLNEKTIENAIKSQINKCMKASDVLNQALKLYNIDEFDKLLKTVTRLRKISIVNIRKSDIYKKRISNADFGAFTEAEWNTIRRQIFDNDIGKIVKDMKETRHELKTYSELYNDFCSKLQIPNKDEWSNISSQVKENKEKAAQQKINKENAAQLARQIKNKDKTLTCPHCQCKNRKFAPMGLEQHIESIHKR